MICANCNKHFANFGQRINNKLTCYPCVVKLGLSKPTDFNPAVKGDK